MLEPFNYRVTAAKLFGKVLRRSCGLASTFYTKVTENAYRGGYVARDGTWDYVSPSGDQCAFFESPKHVRQFIEGMAMEDDVEADLPHAEHLNIDQRHDLAVYDGHSVYLQTFAFFKGEGSSRQLVASCTELTAAAYVESRLKEWRQSGLKGENRPVLLYSMAHVDALLKEAEDSKYCRKPWREIDEEEFDRMLTVLPPCKWQTVNSVNIFFVSEAQTSNIHSFYARTGGRYFTKYARTTTPYAVLAEEVHDFIRNNPKPSIPQHEKPIEA